MRLLPIIMSLALAGCVQMQPIENRREIAIPAALKSEIEREVTRNFLDPSSAQFRDLRMVDVSLASGATERRVCGEVNGRNAYGGYTGLSMFGGTVNDGRFQQVDFFAPCEAW